STRSDRLSFAYAETRTSQLIDSYRGGRRRDLDAEHVGSKRDVRLYLRQREPQIEVRFPEATVVDETNRSRQLALKVAVLDPDGSVRGALSHQDHQAPRQPAALAMGVHVIADCSQRHVHDAPIRAQLAGAGQRPFGHAAG